MVSLSESASFFMLHMFEQVEDLQKLRFKLFRLEVKQFNIRRLLISIFDKMRIQAEF